VLSEEKRHVRACDPLSGTGHTGAWQRPRRLSNVVGRRHDDSGQSPSMMMVTIMRCRIVCFLRFQADAVIRSAKGWITPEIHRRQQK